ncbi:MAG: hypothetical protein AB7N70_34935 [Dehalococcoidia bacterium]
MAETARITGTLVPLDEIGRHAPTVPHGDPYPRTQGAVDPDQSEPGLSGELGQPARCSRHNLNPAVPEEDRPQQARRLRRGAERAGFSCPYDDLPQQGWSELRTEHQSVTKPGPGLAHVCERDPMPRQECPVSRVEEAQSSTTRVRDRQNGVVDQSRLARGKQLTRSGADSTNDQCECTIARVAKNAASGKVRYEEAGLVCRHVRKASEQCRIWLGEHCRVEEYKVWSALVVASCGASSQDECRERGKRRASQAQA